MGWRRAHTRTRGLERCEEEDKNESNDGPQDREAGSQHGRGDHSNPADGSMTHAVRQVDPIRCDSGSPGGAANERITDDLVACLVERKSEDLNTVGE